MSIPSAGVDIDLEKAVPTKTTVTMLQSQLDAIGLTCPDANPDDLERYIEEVRASYPNGRVQCFDIRKADGSSVPTGEGKEITRGNWTAPEPWEFTKEIACIQIPENFDWLIENRPSFQGRKFTQPQYSGKDPTVDIIKGLFTDVAHNISASLNRGINQEAVEAAISTAITPMEDQDADDYDPGLDNRVILLVDQYDEDDKSAGEVGVLNVEWKLFIKNYKKKKEPLIGKKWTLDVTTRSVLYNDVDDLKADYLAISQELKGASPRMRVPRKSRKSQKSQKSAVDSFDFDIPSVELEIFPKLPEASHDTFDRGLPLIAKQEYADVVILYSASFENIGSIDNTKSEAESTWSRSVSRGFTFEAAQEISSTTSLQVSAVVATVTQSITLAFSFTESWNTTTTETIQFTVPPGRLAFTYQGFVMSRILRYTPKTDSFEYLDRGRALSPSICTSDVPLEFK